MSEAPKRIYLDGDVEAGDGMFPRCFENPKYASEPQVEYVRADLVQAAVAAALREAANIARASFGVVRSEVVRLSAEGKIDSEATERLLAAIRKGGE